jgi:hypothetical protein
VGTRAAVSPPLEDIDLVQLTIKSRDTAVVRRALAEAHQLPGVVLIHDAEPRIVSFLERGFAYKGRSAQIIRRLPKKRRDAEGERLYFAVLLSQVRNRYLDSQMRLKIPLSRYLTRSTKANAPKTMFTAGSIQSDIEFSGRILALVPKKNGPGFPGPSRACRAEVLS